MPYNGYAHNLQASPIEGESRGYRLGARQLERPSRVSREMRPRSSLSPRQTAGRYKEVSTPEIQQPLLLGTNQTPRS